MQCSAVEEEEVSSCLCLDCEIPKELLLHKDQLMPPLEIGFGGNIWNIQQFRNRMRRRRKSTVGLGDWIKIIIITRDGQVEVTEWKI